MNCFFRLGPVVTCPSQEFALNATGTTELAWNQELHHAHFGEDGPGFHLVTTRECFIEAQNFGLRFHEFQEWYADEQMNALMDQEI